MANQNTKQGKKRVWLPLSYCAGQKVLTGFNDLQSQFVEISNEWDYEKNKILPSETSTGTTKKFWWKCSVCGNSYLASVYNRTHNNSGCPKCAKRNRTSFPEQAVFFYLKKVYPDAINGYREDAFDKMELDIFIPSLKIAIEYDGLNGMLVKSKSNVTTKSSNFANSKEFDLYVLMKMKN